MKAKEFMRGYVGKGMEPGDDVMTAILVVLGLISLVTMLYIGCAR